MKEILFRAKRKDNGEWIYGDLVNGDMIVAELEDTTNATGEYYGQTPYVGFVDIIPETVCQFTGMVDKNGTKIFERDVILYYDQWHYIVYWDDEKLGFYIAHDDDPDEKDYLGSLFNELCEVIGYE